MASEYLFGLMHKLIQLITDILQINRTLTAIFILLLL